MCVDLCPVLARIRSCETRKLVSPLASFRTTPLFCPALPRVTTTKNLQTPSLSRTRPQPHGSQCPAPLKLVPETPVFPRTHEEMSEEAVEQGARLGVDLGFPSQLFTSYRLQSQEKKPQSAKRTNDHEWTDARYLLSASFPTVEVVHLHHDGYARL